MSNTFTNNFNTHLSRLFWNCIQSHANTTYYLTAEKSVPFADDQNPPAPNTSSYATHIALHDEMVFGIKLETSDLSFMVNDTHWTSGEVYDMYDDRDDTLSSKPFFVIRYDGGDYHYFYKCLKNNYGAASTYSPTDIGTDVFETSDGYSWKYMGKISHTDYTKFDNEYYSPIDLDDADVLSAASAAVDGALDVIVVESAGYDYNAFITGSIKEPIVGGNVLKFYIQSDSTLSANANFYAESAIYINSGTGSGQIKRIVEYGVEGNNKYIIVESEYATVPNNTSNFEIGPWVEIVGDGTGATAKAVVNTATYSIDDIIVVDRGTGYSWANVNITSNTGIIAESELVPANTATARAIIGPPGGHGANVINELYASKIGISGTFPGASLPDTGSYRKIAFVKNLLFKENTITVDDASQLNVGEVLYQSTTGTYGTISAANTTSNEVTVININGVYDTSNVVGIDTQYTAQVSSINNDYNYFDCRTKLNLNITSGSGYNVNELVTQDGNSNAYGYVHSVDGANVYITQMMGEFDVSANSEILVGNDSSTQGYILSKTDSVIVHGSGEFLYVENMEPIYRHTNQNETMKIVIEF